MNAWSHFPNAAHIDRILESLKTHPNIWTADSDAAQAAARDVARDLLRNEDWRAAWFAARNEIWTAAFNTTRSDAWNAAWPSIVALVAWDDCNIYLNMTYEELKVYAILSERHQAILLLPAVRAFEQIKALETV